MTTIGVLGGSFNPPHVAHQWLALYALETAVDAVWVVPTYRHVFGKSLAAYDARVAMCEAAFAPLAGVTVSRIEEELALAPGFVASRMLDTLEALAARTGAALRLIVGSDILGETHAWHRWEDVARLAPPFVVAREGFVAPTGATVSGVELPRVSSTEIRARLARGDDASGLVPRRVIAVIRARSLYAKT